MKQVEQVKKLMSDGDWWTLAEISKVLKQPTQSISARIRDLRKKEFGSFFVVKRHLVNNIYEYKIVF